MDCRLSDSPFVSAAVKKNLLPSTSMLVFVREKDRRGVPIRLGDDP